MITVSANRSNSYIGKVKAIPRVQEANVFGIRGHDGGQKSCKIRSINEAKIIQLV